MYTFRCALYFPKQQVEYFTNKKYCNNVAKGPLLVFIFCRGLKMLWVFFFLYFFPLEVINQLVLPKQIWCPEFVEGNGFMKNLNIHPGDF